jgi:hypothetical protein
MVLFLMQMASKLQTCGAPIYYKRVIEVIEQKNDPDGRIPSTYQSILDALSENQLHDKTGAAWL